MALTKGELADQKTKGLDGIAVQVADTLEVFDGAIVQIGAPNHATTAKRGRVEPYAAEPEGVLAGRALKTVTGDTAATPIPTVSVGTEAYIEDNVFVSGVTGISDVMKPVFLLDDDVLTLTRSSPNLPAGYVLGFVATNQARVLRLGLVESVLQGQAGGDQTTLLLGTISGNISASGNALTGVVAPFHGKILSVHAVVGEAMVSAGASSTINLEVEALNVTGGVVTWSGASANGVKLAGTAVTGNAIFHEGDLIDVEVVKVVASTDGFANVYAVVQRLVGL